MKANSLCLIMAALLPGAVYAQAILEHAAAAAGATAGTAGGKALSNLINKTLNSAAEASSKAAETKKPENKNLPASSAKGAASAAPAPDLSGAPAPASARRATRTARASRPAAPIPDKPVFAVEEQNAPPPAASLPPPPPTADDFAKIKEGGARQDVFAALGTPSSHITIPDDGHLIEILTYSDGSRRLGSVRLDNGQVVSVSTAFADR